MPTITEFKGNSLLNLNPDDKFIFSFGLSKAKMILANIDAIKIFVDTDGQSCEPKPDISNMIETSFSRVGSQDYNIENSQTLIRHDFTVEEILSLFDLPFNDLILKSAQIHRKFHPKSH